MLKWIVVAALVSLPALGLAVTKYRAHACPITPDCPCARK